MTRFQLGCQNRGAMLYLPVALLLAGPRAVAAQHAAGATCPGPAGGGMIKVRDYQVVFSADRDSTGSTFSGLAIVRTSREGRGRRPAGALAERLAAVRLRHPGSGANVGPVMIVHDPATHTVWINDSLPVSLAQDNNVLLGTVDAHGVFSAVGQARIDPHLPISTEACTEAAEMKRFQEASDTLWSRFQASAQIRAFLSP